MLTKRSRIPYYAQELRSNLTLPTSDQFPTQAARILEHIETLEIQYAESLDKTNVDLKNSLRICAVAMRAYLETVDFEAKTPLK